MPAKYSGQTSAHVRTLLVALAIKTRSCSQAVSLKLQTTTKPISSFNCLSLIWRDSCCFFMILKPGALILSLKFKRETGAWAAKIEPLAHARRLTAAFAPPDTAFLTMTADYHKLDPDDQVVPTVKFSLSFGKGSTFLISL